MSFVNSSSHAIRMRAEVAGEGKGKLVLIPRSFLAAAIASLMAKNVEIPRKSGGSPTACGLDRHFRSFHKVAIHYCWYLNDITKSDPPLMNIQLSDLEPLSTN